MRDSILNPSLRTRGEVGSGVFSSHRTPKKDRSPNRSPSTERGVAALLIALLLAGCAVDQKAEVAQYRKELDRAVPLPSNQEPANGPFRLIQAMALANQNDEALGLRGEDYIQALINKSRAVANFLPTVSFAPNYTVEDRPTGSASSGTGPAGTGIGSGNTAGGTGSSGTASVASGGFAGHGNLNTRFEAPVVGNINLFRGGQDIANLKVADFTIEQRRQLLLDTQQTVMINVAQVFYQVLRSEKQVEVLRNSLKVQDARVRDVEGQLANGLSTKLAVAQARSQAGATRATLSQAEGDVSNGRLQLANLVGTPGVTTPLADDLRVPDQRPPVAEIEADAVAQRQDLLAAQSQLRAARAAVDAAVAEYYPSISLNVSGFLYREFYGDASKWAAVFQGNLPIFSAGLIRADVRAAWSRLRQAALNESSVRRQAITDVEQSYQNLLTAERRLRDLQDEVAAADEALKQAQSALTNSLAIELDVLTAQDQLLNAELALASAQFDRSIFYLDLLRATGDLPKRLNMTLPTPPGYPKMPQTSGEAVLIKTSDQAHHTPATTRPAQ